MNWAVRRGLMLAMAGILLLIPAMVWAQDKQEPLKAELTAHKTSGTLYEKFRFTVKARGGQAPYQYLWLGKYKRKASVDIDFRSPGNKSIWVLVKDAAGNSFRVAKQIVVRPQECRVSIRPTPGPNHFNQRDVVVMMGELVDLRAMVQGCRVVKYHWSAEPAPAGLAWPAQGWSGPDRRRVAFVSRNLGPTKITLTMTTDLGEEHQAHITIHVGGVQYEVKCAPHGDSALRCRARPQKMLGIKGPFVIRWQPHPEVGFQNQEQYGKTVETLATSNDPDTYRIWVDVLFKDGPLLRKVGESQAIEAYVPRGKN
jgi:hypothetical protein